MSCCCSYIVDTWNPCSCECGCASTTSTSTTTTTTCSGQPCDVVMDPNCIIYNGSNIPCYGIQTGDTAADILQTIIDNFSCNSNSNVITACTLNNYYKLERSWQNPTYTFTLNSMILDGVQYGNGQTLVVNTPTDLVIGVSPFNGGLYFMNINDWLNSISGVAASGFIFYDDMQTLYKPDTNSTFAIEIASSTVSGLNVYYYTSAYGFSVDRGEPNNVKGTYTCEPGQLPITPSARVTAINAAPDGGGGNSSSGRGLGYADNASYMMEKSYQDCNAGGYSFTLNSLVLNGINYARGQQLTISYFEDLRIGLGVDGASPFIMNINDWLNTILDVAGTGFVFYDDMSTIDLPSISATYDIQIISYNISTTERMYYRWFRLGDGTTGWNTSQSNPVAQSPYADVPWISSSPIVTTTTTVIITDTYFTLTNNTAASQITDIDILVPNSGVNFTFPIGNGTNQVSLHNGIFADIILSISSGGRIRVLVDDQGTGNFMQRTCLTFGSGGNITIDAGRMGPLSINSSINIIYDNGGTC